MKFLGLVFLIFILLFSCTKKDISSENANVAEQNITSMENHDWITEYGWGISSGRLSEHSQHIVDLIRLPRVDFYLFEIPQRSVLYQERIRNTTNTLFYYLYHTDNDELFFRVRSTWLDNRPDPFIIRFDNNYSRMSRRSRGNISLGSGIRNGEQFDQEYPLVGTWVGSIEYDYRLVDPVDAIYYMDIIDHMPESENGMPLWAIRSGTYLLKQTGDKTFETISPLPDGKLRLEIINERSLLLTPLFTLPEGEEGFLTPLTITGGYFKHGEGDEIDWDE